MEQTYQRNQISFIVSDVSIKYGNKNALKNVSLQLIKNGIHGVIGNNGAGKTTLMKTIIGFIKPDNGTIIFVSDKVSDIAFSPEDPVLYEHLTGTENLNFSASVCSRASNKYNSSKFDINWIQDATMLASRMSAGNRKKLSLGMALATDRNVILLDEPFRGLDPISRYNIKNLLTALKNEKTIFISTHELSFSESLFDEVTILHDGAIVFSGPLQCVLGRFSADNLEQAFINAINNDGFRR